MMLQEKTMFAMGQWIIQKVWKGVREKRKRILIDYWIDWLVSRNQLIKLRIISDTFGRSKQKLQLDKLSSKLLMWWNNNSRTLKTITKKSEVIGWCSGVAWVIAVSSREKCKICRIKRKESAFFPPELSISFCLMNFANFAHPKEEEREKALRGGWKVILFKCLLPQT